VLKWPFEISKNLRVFYYFKWFTALAKLPLFNIAKRGFCTCLPKYNLNTYLGRCGHGCIYCYAVKFPSFTGPTLPRTRLVEQIAEMTKNTRLKLPVMLSDCTDPYQPLERKYKITRRCIEVLTKHKFPLLIVTKSDLVLRDIDLFHLTPTVVSITVTTLDEKTAKFWEPNAPPPKLRIAALQKLAEEGITTTARVDPIIPGINDNTDDFEKLVKVLAEVGVRQITTSTFKPVRGFFKTLRKLNYGLYKRLYSLYSDGKWILGYKYLSDEKRRRIMERLRPIVLKYGLEFSSCREGFPELNTTLCDGTAFCRDMLDRFVDYSSSE